MWKMSLSSFWTGFSGCITFNDVEGVAIIAANDDGWNIDSIVTFARDSANNFQLNTQNFEVYRWVDGDGAVSHKRFDLKLV